MNLKLKRSALLKATQIVSNVVSTKSTLPVLGNILLEVEGGTLSLSATDLEVSIKCHISQETDESGALTVNARRFLGIIRELEADEIDISADSSFLSIDCKRSHYKLPVTPKSDFPAFPNIDSGETFTADAGDLLDMLKKSTIAVLHEDIHKVLCGINLVVTEDKKLVMVATDKHRLAVNQGVLDESGIQEKMSFILPKKAVDELIKILAEVIKEQESSVTVRVSSNQLLFDFKTITFFTRLIDGVYPDYNRLIPKGDFKTIYIDRDPLIRAVKRVSLLANENTRAIKLVFSKDILRICSNNTDAGDATEEIEYDYQGEEFSVGYNYRYLLDVLSVLTEDRVRYNYSQPLSPAIIRPEISDSYQYIIMPMKI